MLKSGGPRKLRGSDAESSKRFQKRHQVGDLLGREGQSARVLLLLEDLFERSALPIVQERIANAGARSEGGLNSRLPTSSLNPTSYRSGDVYSGATWHAAHFCLEYRSPAIRRRRSVSRCSRVALRSGRKCREISRQVGDLRIRRLRPVHRGRDRFANLVVEMGDRSGPGPGPVAATPSREGTRLGIAVRSVTQGVAQEVVRMPIGVTAMAAHPAVV